MKIKEIILNEKEKNFLAFCLDCYSELILNTEMDKIIKELFIRGFSDVENRLKLGVLNQYDVITLHAVLKAVLPDALNEMKLTPEQVEQTKQLQAKLYKASINLNEN